MGTFKTKTETTANIATTYSGRTLVYLEGKTDVALFANHWFVNEASRLDFKEPETTKGCNGVVASVAEMRRDGRRAFGIIDRDKLQADQRWDLVWETDDDTFARSKPYGDHVRVTCFWELENYLVDPEAVEHYVALRDGGRRARPKEDATLDCLQHAEALIPHAALNGALRSEGKAEWGDGATSQFRDRTAFEAHLKTCHERGDIETPIWDCFKENLERVEAFANAATPCERLRGLLRRVNGKALIHRIKKAGRLQDDPTFSLADLIRRDNRIPDELKSYVNEFAQSSV